MVQADDLAPKGPEFEPHITIRYGLLTDDPSVVADALDGVRGPITASIGGAAVFEGNDEGDVLVLLVDSPDLVSLHEVLSSELEHAEDTHPNYTPHITIAYLKPGKADAYLDIGCELEGEAISAQEIVFSNTNGEQYAIELDAPQLKKAGSITYQFPLRPSEKLLQIIEDAIYSVFQDESWIDDLMEGYEASDSVSELLDKFTQDFDQETVQKVQDALMAGALESAVNVLTTLGLDENTAMFDLINTDALAYAQERAAEMVGMKWVDGELVPNPNAEFAITDTTREGLKTLIESAYTDGLTPAQLGDAIRGSYNFSQDRSDLIALTEMNRASTQGTLAAFRRSGVVTGKSVLLSNDHKIEDECDEAESDGVIPLDQDFSNGEDGPPFHPGCWCVIVAHVDESDEGE